MSQLISKIDGLIPVGINILKKECVSYLRVTRERVANVTHDDDVCVGVIRGTPHSNGLKTGDSDINNSLINKSTDYLKCVVRINNIIMDEQNRFREYLLCFYLLKEMSVNWI